MKKYLICLVVLFSAFLVSDKVSAREISQFCDYTEPCLTTEDIDTIIKNNNIDTSIHNAYLFTVAKGRFSDNSPKLTIFFFNYKDMLNNKIYINEYLSSLGALYSSNYPISIYSLHLEGNFKYDLSQEIVLNYAYHSGTPGGISHAIHFGNSTEDFYTYYTNVDILDENGNIVFPANNLSPDEEFTINFHLNGGVAVDSYQSNIEKNELIDKVKEVLEIDKMLELYPSLSGSMMDLFDDPSEKKFSKFCKDWIIDVETQYEALKYYQKLINKDYTQPITYTEDFSIKIYPEDFEDYIKNLSITKQNMRFQGFFYDKQFANEISNNFLIDSDKDIYAKWDYEDVNAFLNDTNFNSYTFDTNYTYAIISIGKNYGQDIYLGLDFLGYNLEIYRYKKDGNNLEKGSSFCITPYYSKGDKYYYRIKTTDTSNYNIFILPREKLETVQNGEVINYYNFLVSDNAHVTYTNDLKSIVIFDDNDNELIIDLEDRYNYAQDALISDESNLLGIFKELLGNMDDNIFSYFNQIWNQFKANKFYTYFMLLIAGGLVILIIKAANRK